MLSTLYNCTLNDNTASFGGGACYCTLYNCTLTGNTAYDGGGGANTCTLYNCALSGNVAGLNGDGVTGGTLNNCTLTENGNSPSSCAVCQGRLNNCIVYYNYGSAGKANYDTASVLSYCCATPKGFGVGNIDADPIFVDFIHGNLRLQANSPCINAGNHAYASGSTDLGGRPRIVGPSVDIGAYEFTGPFDGWLQGCGLPTDGSADFIDSDGDGMNNWQEWICGTDPTNPLSALRLLSPSITSTNATVTWQSVAGVNYFLERGANLAVPFTLLATNIVGQAGATSYADTNATGAGPFFYRVGVKSP